MTHGAVLSTKTFGACAFSRITHAVTGALVGAVFLATGFTMVTRLTFAQGNAAGGVADAMVVAVIGASGHIARIAHETAVAFAFSFDTLAVVAPLGASL